jgi:hypothetical protein
MPRTQHALFLLAPVFALGNLACVGSPVIESEETNVEDEAAIVPPARDLIGTFRNDVYFIGSVPLLVLKLDGTYHRGMIVGCTATTPCTPAAADGRYTLWQRDAGTYMSLYPFDRTGAVEHYRYALQGSTLRLLPLGSATWMSLQRTEDAAWCGVPEDCSLQNLPVGPCASQWRCVSSVCSYSCGPVWSPE